MVRTRDPPSSATSVPIFRPGISARHDPFGLQIALAIVGMSRLSYYLHTQKK